MTDVSLGDIKNDFPIFSTYPDLVYLDNGATSQKPKVVIDAVSKFYTEKNANIHRGIYKLAEAATETYENTRLQVADFINAKKAREIIFTANTNQAINLAAYGWGRKFLNSGDIIVLSEMEHHANILPWLRLREEKGIKLIFLPIDKNYRLDYEAILNYQKDFGEIKLVALTQASNVLGTVNPVGKIIAFFKKQGIQAKFLVDTAQSIPHMQVDVQSLDADFIAFSAHKMLGPAGVGVLWAKEELLEEMDPLFVGSNMVNSVTKEKAIWSDIPDKFEAGTGNLEGVAGFSAALSYIIKAGMENISVYEQGLIEYGLLRLKQIPGLKIFGPENSDMRLGVFSFGIEGAHPHDIAQILDSKNIAIRSGHHCAQIAMRALDVAATARASIYAYNTKIDIDKLADGLVEVRSTLRL